MKTLILICFAFAGILNVYAGETNKPSKPTATKQIADDTTATTANTGAESA
ncbi:hypothetical protein DOY81_013430, partial [Sarcophaga bullata]